MAIHGLDYAKEDWFVSDDDPGKRDTLEESMQNEATVFFHRPIPNVVMTEIQDDQSFQTVRALTMGESTGMEQVVNSRTTKRNRECFRFGVKRWANFCLPDGTPVPLTFDRVMRGQRTYDVVSEESLNSLHLSTLNEVGAEIFARNSMDDAKRKKFAAALSGLGGFDHGTADNAAGKTSMSADAFETRDAEKPKTSKRPSKPNKSKTPTSSKPMVVAQDGSNPSLGNLSGPTP